MYKFIINTDKYAGNFERELTAFITGEVGECKVGTKFIDSNFEYPIEFKEKIEQVSDDYNTYRPCSVYQFSGVCIYFHTKPSEKLIQVMYERAKLFTGTFQVKECYLITTLISKKLKIFKLFLVFGWNCE